MIKYFLYLDNLAENPYILLWGERRNAEHGKYDSMGGNKQILGEVWQNRSSFRIAKDEKSSIRNFGDKR